ncbi:hypothetical protein PVK06_031178 [Gossypium arboreum]|uniref:Uncharacterized protein n=1 Tax=Gossypium arboreum TaxID=29729 RepID=A0ABR0NRC3_GOSAR|nr:hypothetical protein PVK06_031178 [Gossypium arboreum]
MGNFIRQLIHYDCKAITLSYTEVLKNDQELYFGWDISLKVSFKRAVAPCNRWLREEGGGALGIEWRNFRGNTLVIGNMGARLVRPSNGQLRANLG